MTSAPPADPPEPARSAEASAAAGGDATQFAPTDRYDEAPTVLAPAAAQGGGGEAPGNLLPVGTRLAEFEVTAVVGEGGFGVVYAAIDHSLGRRVALKEYMPAALAARAGRFQVQARSERHRETFAAGLRSFVNEARLLSRFDHPALLRVYRFWEANGTAYMAMPFLDGRTLRDLLRERRAAGLPPPDEAWLRGLLAPLTEALLDIHGEQCYHRDIAPDNVMQLPDGRWLLLDFGAARRVIGDMTQALTVILKPGYAPIEQYAEAPGMKQGPWTDVYALAAVVYVAITGRTPPPAVARMLDDPFEPLSGMAAGQYRAEFLAAVDRALAVRPEQRTQSIAQFRRELGLEAGVTPALADLQRAGVPPPQRSGRSASGTQPAPPAPAAPEPSRASMVAGTPAGQAGASPQPRRAALLGIGVAALGAAVVLGYRALQPAPVAPVAAGPAVAGSAIAAGGVADGSAVGSAVGSGVGAAPVAPPAAAPSAALPRPLDPLRELERVLQGQAGGSAVEASAARTTLAIGRDQFRFEVRSERDGYLYLIGLSTDGTLALLMPNEVSGPAVRVRKGQPWRFPTGDRFELQTQDPPGPTRLLVIVSDSERLFDHLGLQAAGPIRVFPAPDELARLAAGHTGGALLAGRPRCPDGVACADAYGAAMLTFQTVRP
jgi:serine/threonine protein kinase